VHQVVELVINNLDGGEHPIHMHGRRMYVIARGKEGSGNFNATSEVNNVDPIIRDSITVAGTSYIGASLLPYCVFPAFTVL
jgi:FtsP/CotA-like multicopper oxidase with cupredoxin domain